MLQDGAACHGSVCSFSAKSCEGNVNLINTYEGNTSVTRKSYVLNTFEGK